MRKTYTVIALVFAAATAWAQGALTAAPETSVALKIHKSPLVAAATLPGESDLIKEQPVGVAYKNMYRHANVYMAYGTSATNRTYDGYAGDIVVSVDGKKLYIKNPFLKFAPGTWIVGDIKADGTVDFKFPQIVCTENVGGVVGYANKMQITNNNIGVDESTQTVSFKWDGRQLSQVNTSDIIGLTNADGEWLGYGALESCFSEVSDQPVKPTNAANAKTYRMAYSDNSGSVKTGSVRVLVDGTNIYIGDFLQPDCWIKGTISDNKVSFAGPQYLGVYKSVHAYMLPLNPTTYQQLATIDFDYDSKAGTLSSQSAMLINIGNQNLSALDMYATPYLESVSYGVGTPAAPVISGFMAYGSEDPTYGGIEYKLSTLSTTGSQLNQDNIYYNVYADGKLITFKKSEYSYISADMTDVPYGYTDSYTSWTGQKGFDFIADSGAQTIFIYTPFTKLGVKAVYVDGDQRYESAITECPTSTGISNAVSENFGEESVEYHDLSGRKVSANQKGIYVKTIKYGNGQMRSVKVMK